MSGNDTERTKLYDEQGTEMNERRIVYSEPENYFPKWALKKYKLGEFWEESDEKEEKPAPAGKGCESLLWEALKRSARDDPQPDTEDDALMELFQESMRSAEREKADGD